MNDEQRTPAEDLAHRLRFHLWHEKAKLGEAMPGYLQWGHFNSFRVPCEGGRTLIVLVREEVKE